MLIFLVSIVMFIGISFFLCRKIKQNIFLFDLVYYTSSNHNILISRNFCCYRKKIIIQISVHFHEIFVKTKIRTKSASTIWTANCSYYLKACILPIFVNPSTKLSADWYVISDNNRSTKGLFLSNSWSMVSLMLEI